MSGFTALNVEPEDNFEEEVDDTKEIQLEEAFKLYQNALKLHSQGPISFQEARVAYKELLESEVFRYPEVLSDFAHDELDEDIASTAIHPDTGAIALLPSSAAESSASSIPQLIYLAFKNRGQFILDVARHQVSDKQGSRAELCRSYAKACADSIADFAKALERDDTDLDLWKKSARVADILLSTQRIARFCLESVLAGDDDDAQQAIDLSGLDEAFAAGELEEVVDLLNDDLSRLQRPEIRPKNHLLTLLRKTNDPYPYLPQRPKQLEYVNDRYRPLSVGFGQIQLKPAMATLASLGQVIHQTVQAVHDGEVSFNAATNVQVELPEGVSVPQDQTMSGYEDTTTSIDQPSPMQNLSEEPTIDPVAGHGIHESPLGENDTSPEQNVHALENRGENTDETIAIVRHQSPASGEVQNATPAAISDEPQSRKRSTTAAGNEEPEGRTKSRRLRARESLADLAAQEDEAAHDDPQYFLDQLALFEQTDQAMFDVVNSMLAKLDLQFYHSTDEANRAFWQSTATGTLDQSVTGASREDLILLADLRIALLNWTDDKGQATLSGHGHQDVAEKSTGMSLYLQHSKPSLAKGTSPATDGPSPSFISLASLINAEPTNIYDAVFCWLSSLLVGPYDQLTTSLYMHQPWSNKLRDTLDNVLFIAHPQIYETLRQRYTSFKRPAQNNDERILPEVKALFEFTQAWFELHLDQYSTLIGPDHDVLESVRSSSQYRLLQSAGLANDIMNLYRDHSNKLELDDPLIIRFIWASAICATLSEDVDKTHVLLCLQDLKALLQRSKLEELHLPNSSAMPVISTSAIEQEVSRLDTLDFFTSVFDTDNSNPVVVIEKLEPILEPESILETNASLTTAEGQNHSHAGKLIHFLESGDPSLKLFLWRRLQNAYTAISYTPKVVSCLLRSIETSVHELYTPRHLEAESTSRQVSMLKWLRDIDEMMIKLLSKIQADSAAFECVDEHHLHSSLQVVISLTRLLQGFVIYEDSIRVGQTAPPQLKGAAATKIFDKSKDRLREMLVRTYILQYLLLKEATLQHPSAFERAADDLAEYLSTVHNGIGIRHYCKYANKAFVKLVKTELCTLSTKQDHTVDMTQVFYDLYQLRFANGVGDANHGCPTENLDRKTAWSLVPTIMSYAAKHSVKDLAKGELRIAIDKIQNALGVVKSPAPLLYNKKVISNYLKSPIRPDDLYRCIRGIGDLSTRLIEGDTEVAARHGWYFLLGHMSLAKFKSVKRVTPTPTDDLDTAATLFRQDLDHDINKWETWYRLAQVYEAKIEDDLIWNSTKLNDARGDIALLERQAIHSFMMATTMAMRLDSSAPGTAQMIEDMLAEFATRLYASSRPPLNMEAFKTDKNMRHMSSIVDSTMSKQAFHPPLGTYALWKFAAYLLSCKFSDKPKHWTTHYTRSKCLWKMYTSKENQTRRRPVAPEDVLDAIVEAIEVLPKKEKSNEPILEPHFKLVSIIHKLVTKYRMSYVQGQEYMQATRYSHGIHLADDVEEGDEWQEYMLAILEKLSHADKSNWHHRIIDRAAHVVYEEVRDTSGALAAKHHFTQQIFTKTMTIQVWKPEYERPGRHYVYTGRYVAFFIQILEQLNDRTNLDQLVRRIRRKTTDFLDHTRVWEDVAMAYVRLLRRYGHIPDGRERALFDGMNHEEFTKKSEKMEAWALDPDTESVPLDILRDAIDLKRLNNSLMKGPSIEDLIGDAYACLYEEFVAQLPPEEQPQLQPASLPQGTFINMTADVVPGSDEDAERARLNNILRAQGDGSAEGPFAVSVSAPVGLGLQGQSTPLPGGAGHTAMPEVHRVPGKPGRTKTVTRREIQRKAEAVISKPPPIKTPILSKRPAIEIVIDNTQSPMARQAADAEGQADDSRANSPKGSIRDSADGEDDSGSELSELDDMDLDKKQLFSEMEQAREQADDADDDEAGDEAGEGEEGEEGSLDDEHNENEDEEMEDIGDEVDGEGGGDGEGEGEGELEIQDSQENMVRDSPGEQDEFHEAREH